MSELVLNTLEDVQNAFPDEESARKYIATIRWGQWAKCVYCGNEKCYFIENGKRYKCANKECSKKFSVGVCSLMEFSKISFEKWVQIAFLFVKTRGRILSHEITSQVDISDKNEYGIREKLEFVFNKIDRVDKPNKEILDDLFKGIMSYYYLYKEIRRSPHYHSPYTIKDEDIDNIGDIKQYNKLLRYTKYYIKVYCHWIFMDFGKAEDVLSETFLFMSENNIKEYNGSLMIKMIQQAVSRMWRKHLNEHPKYNEHESKRVKKAKIEGRHNLATWYIICLIKSKKEHKHKSYFEIKKDKQLISDTRKKLAEFRSGKHLKKIKISRPRRIPLKGAIVQLKDGIVINNFNSAAAAAKATGINPVYISRILIKEKKTIYGFSFKMLTEMKGLLI